MNTTNTKAVGERSEGIILAHLLTMGWAVSVPFGNNQRYDLVVDDGDRLLRVQCKTGRLINGCVSFSVASKNGFTNKRQSYHGQVDIFLIYCPKNDKVYLVPVDITQTNEMRLRIDPPRNVAPMSTIKWTKDYELA
jgi:hypothetical protein